MTREEKFMAEAIALLRKLYKANQGGPFGCVIVKTIQIVGRGIIRSHQPTTRPHMRKWWPYTRRLQEPGIRFS